MPEGDELEDTADAESCESNEASTVSGDNDGKCLITLIVSYKHLLLCLTECPSISVSLDETSSNASCSTESQSKASSTARESSRTASQVGKCGTNGNKKPPKGSFHCCMLLGLAWQGLGVHRCLGESYGHVSLGEEFLWHGGIIYKEVILNTPLFVNVINDWHLKIYLGAGWFFIWEIWYMED